MSESAHIIPFPESHDRPAELPRPHARARDSLRGAWLGWWAAGCLLLLAYNAHRQLEIQRRLLAGSRTLEGIVAESRTVSAETNRQLAQIQKLEAATLAMDERLARLGSLNGRIKGRLRDLEGTVAEVQSSLAALEEQAGASKTALDEVARESSALYATLQDSRRVSDRASGHIQELVRLQEAINVDLADLARKTRFLERKE